MTTITVPNGIFHRFEDGHLLAAASQLGIPAGHKWPEMITVSFSGREANFVKTIPVYDPAADSDHLATIYETVSRTCGVRQLTVLND